VRATGRGRNVYVAWHQLDATAASPNRRTVWLARSSNYGQTFTALRVGCAHIAFDQFNTPSASFERPWDLDIAASYDGKCVALAYPYQTRALTGSGVFNMMLAVSKNAGVSFQCFDVTPESNTPPVPDAPWLDSCGRPRLAVSPESVHVTFQRSFPAGHVRYRTLTMSDLAISPPVTAEPLIQPPAAHPPMQTHAAAAAKGPLAVVFLQSMKQVAVVFTSASGAQLTAVLDPDYPGGMFAFVHNHGIAAVPGGRTSEWCAAGTRWGPRGGAVRATLFRVRTPNALHTQSTTVYAMATGEWAKKVHVYADPGSNGRVYVVFERGPNGAITGDIMLGRSVDGGQTFT
jgi:hypothetical protein